MLLSGAAAPFRAAWRNRLQAAILVALAAPVYFLAADLIKDYALPYDLTSAVPSLAVWLYTAIVVVVVARKTKEIAGVWNRWVAVGAVAVSLPLSFAATFVSVIIIGVGIVAGIIWLFNRPKTAPAKRGASSHFNADGRPKVSYSNSRKADKAASLYESDRGETMNAYKCGDCSGWHIGHAR